MVLNPKSKQREAQLCVFNQKYQTHLLLSKTRKICPFCSFTNSIYSSSEKVINEDPGYYFHRHTAANTPEQLDL